MSLSRLRGLLALPLLVALVFAGCGGQSDAASAQEIADRKIRVTTTTNWHTDLARRIGGDRVEVTGLMGPGVDPHLYQASAGDVRTLGESDIAIWNGIDLEGKMEEVFAQIGKSVPVVTVGEAVSQERLIRVTGVPGEEFDPHIWFDPELWGQAARAVADAYKTMDPQHASGYDQRLRDFRATLEQVDAETRQMVEQIPARSRVLVTSHDAFSYYARTYGMEVAAIQGKSTAGEATTADIRRVAETVARADVSTIFPESSVPPQTIRAVLAAARERGQEVEVAPEELYGDALGQPGTPQGNFAGALRFNTRLIAEGLAPQATETGR